MSIHPQSRAPPGDPALHVVPKDQQYLYIDWTEHIGGIIVQDHLRPVDLTLHPKQTRTEEETLKTLLSNLIASLRKDDEADGWQPPLELHEADLRYYKKIIKTEIKRSKRDVLEHMLSRAVEPAWCSHLMPLDDTILTARSLRETPKYFDRGKNLRIPGQMADVLRPDGEYKWFTRIRNPRIKEEKLHVEEVFCLAPSYGPKDLAQAEGYIQQQATRIEDKAKAIPDPAHSHLWDKWDRENTEGLQDLQEDIDIPLFYRSQPHVIATRKISRFSDMLLSAGPVPQGKEDGRLERGSLMKAIWLNEKYTNPISPGVLDQFDGGSERFAVVEPHVARGDALPKLPRTHAPIAGHVNGEPHLAVEDATMDPRLEPRSRSSSSSGSITVWSKSQEESGSMAPLPVLQVQSFAPEPSRDGIPRSVIDLTKDDLVSDPLLVKIRGVEGLSNKLDWDSIYAPGSRVNHDAEADCLSFPTRATKRKPTAVPRPPQGLKTTSLLSRPPSNGPQAVIANSLLTTDHRVARRINGSNLTGSSQQDNKDKLSSTILPSLLDIVAQRAKKAKRFSTSAKTVKSADTTAESNTPRETIPSAALVPTDTWRNNPSLSNPKWVTDALNSPIAPPSSPISILTTLETMQQRQLVRALRESGFELVEREYKLQGTDLILSPQSGVIFLPLTRVRDESAEIVTDIKTAACFFLRVMVIIEILPFTSFGRRETLELNPLTPDITKALSALKRKVAGTCLPGQEGRIGSVDLVCCTEGPVQATQILHFALGQDLEAVRKGVAEDVILDLRENAEWLSMDVDLEQEQELAQTFGINSYTAVYIVRRCGGIAVFVDMRPEERGRTFGPIFGEGVITRFNKLYSQRVAEMEVFEREQAEDSLTSSPPLLSSDPLDPAAHGHSHNGSRVDTVLETPDPMDSVPRYTDM